MQMAGRARAGAGGLGMTHGEIRERAARDKAAHVEKAGLQRRKKAGPLEEKAKVLMGIKRMA